MPMKGIGGASLQTAITGAPLAVSAINGPAAIPISMLPAVIAWTSLLPPVKSEIFTSSPCLAKMPSFSPTFTGSIGDALESALPTLSVAAAYAVDPKTNNPEAATSAAKTRQRSRILLTVSSLRLRCLHLMGHLFGHPSGGERSSHRTTRRRDVGQTSNFRRRELDECRCCYGREPSKSPQTA